MACKKGGTVYMLPGDADLDDPTCKPDSDFLPIRDIFTWCREDLDVLARQVTFCPRLCVLGCGNGPSDAVELAGAAGSERAQKVGAVLLVLSRLDGVGRPAGGTQPICTGAPRRESGHFCSGRATQGGPGSGVSADARAAPGPGSDGGGIAQHQGGLVFRS